MITQKSYEEFALGVYDAQLVDCASHYPALAREFARDSLRVRSAVESQGIRFLMDTLPSFRKHFDKCLQNGRLTSSGLPHMRPFKRGGVVPRLFRGLLLRVFDSSGALRIDPDVTAIRLLRQLYSAVAKMEMQSSRQDTAKAAIDFFKTDREVKSGDLQWDNHLHFDAQAALGLSYTDDPRVGVSLETPTLFPELEPTPLPPKTTAVLGKIQQVADLISAYLGVFNPYEWKPKHGPGAVSDQRWGAYKYAFTNWPDRLESVFPYADFALANYAQMDVDSPVASLSKDFLDERGSKLISVPKTLTTPRLIASEPTSHQWCQQIIKDYFYRRTRDTFISRFISFEDQTKNGRLALRASLEQSHATIDLSSASDRVSCWHVERLFRRLPCLLGALQSCRTSWIQQSLCRDFPRYQPVRKYSTMGNATIFPVQSLFFLSVALGCVAYAKNLKVTPGELRRLGDMQVRVFGDDIIVPEDCAVLVADTLTTLGLKVNANKTFLAGKFKESCGVDAYGGHVVTPIRILKNPVRTSPGSLVSSVDVHHNLCEAGFMATAAYVQKTAARTVSNTIRFVEHGSGLFGWSNLFGATETNTRVRHNPALNRVEIRCLRPKVTEQRATNTESAGLLQYFTEAAKEVTSRVSNHGWLLQRPKSGLGLGWVSAA